MFPVTCHGVDQGVDLIEYMEWWMQRWVLGSRISPGYQQHFAYRIVHDVDTPYHIVEAKVQVDGDQAVGLSSVASI
jgi:hypothetical protein